MTTRAACGSRRRIGTVARPLPPINLLLVRTASPRAPAPGKRQWAQYELSYAVVGEKRPLLKRLLWTRRGDAALKPKGSE